MSEILSWITLVIGVLGFWLSGKKLWWSWYVNLANQAIWFLFAIISGYYAFLVAAIFYTIVFTRNAYLWTKEHYAEPDWNSNKSVHRFENDIIILGGPRDSDLHQIKLKFDSRAYSEEMSELKSKIEDEFKDRP